MGGVSYAYSHIRTARARVRGWVGAEKLRHRVHREPTGWMEYLIETRLGVPQNGGNSLVFDCLRSKRDPVHREGCGIPQNGGNRLLFDLLQSKRGPVDLEGCGVPQNGWNILVLERYGRNVVLFIGRGVAYRKNGTPRDTVHLHRRLSPRATVHPRSTSSSLHLRLFIQPPPLLHRLLFNQPSPRGLVQPPLHGLLFIQPSTGYCSTSPARGHPIHPALHGILFIRPSTGSNDQGPIHPAATASTTTGSCSSTPHRELFIHPPNNAHCSSRGSMFDRL